jgi:hypothetical protein
MLPLAHVSLFYLVILLFHLFLVLTVWLFLSHFLTLTLHALLFSLIRATRSAHFIFTAYHVKKQEYFQKIKISASYSLCNLSIILLLSSYQAQIFPSIPYAQTRSPRILPLMGEARFHTHQIQQETERSKTLDRIVMRIFRI